MLIALKHNVYLSELGWLNVGEHDVADGLAAALVYQGAATRVEPRGLAPSRVAAVVPPLRARRAKSSEARDVMA